MSQVHRSVKRGMPVPATLLALLCLAVPAAAAKHHSKGFTVKVKSGTLTLTFTAETLKSIDSGSPTVGTVTTPVAPATAASGVFSFPIDKGSLNSLTGHGTFAAQGGFTIESHLSLGGLFESSSSASAANPAATLGRSSTMTLTSANFSPSTVPVFTLGLTHAKVAGNRHQVSITKLPVALTAIGAQFFGSAFKAGEQVATATVLAKG
jgi:hypothetical protein